MKRVCLDEMVRSSGGGWQNISDVVQAGKRSVQLINEYFTHGESFNQETALCGKTILNNIDRAIKLGYQVDIHFIGLESPQIAIDRVNYRVQLRKVAIYKSGKLETSFPALPEWFINHFPHSA